MPECGLPIVLYQEIVSLEDLRIPRSMASLDIYKTCLLYCLKQDDFRLQKNIVLIIGFSRDFDDIQERVANEHTKTKLR